LVDAPSGCIVNRMPGERGGLFHKLRGHIGFAALSGILIAVTGFGPDEWFRKLFEKLPEYAIKLWPSGWDLRLVPVTIGMLLIVGDVLWHRHRAGARQETEPAAAPAPVPVHLTVSLADLPASAPTGRNTANSDRPTPVPAAGLPRSVGELFKGREDLLRRVHTALTRAAQGQSPIVALHGLGGIGKTRVAVEYAWAHRQDYPAVLFAIGDAPEALRRNLAGLGQQLGLPQREATDEAVQLQAVLDWLQSHPGWLLIFDNVDTRGALMEALRLVGGTAGGHVLMTSRLENFPPHFARVSVDLLSPEAAEEFLLQRAPWRRHAADDPARAAELARELGWLALALEHAGAYIDTRRIGFADYLDIWRNSREKVIGWADPSITGYDRSIAETWQVSVEQLTEVGRHLLQRLAFLAPEPVPEFLLDVPVPAAEDEDLREAIVDLAAYSLVARDPDAEQFSVHRLVQDATRRSLDPAASRQRLTEALGWVDFAFDHDAEDVRTWPRLNRLAPHAANVAEHADKAQITEPTARLVHQLSLLYSARSLYSQAELLERRALAINEAKLGIDHPNVAACLNNLGRILEATNRPAAAEPLYRRALTINQKSYGSDHPTVAANLINLAGLLRDTNRPAEAEPLCRRALAIDEKRYGPDHPEVATDLNNLAGLLRSTNRPAEAERLLRRALAINKKSRGADHPRVATNLSNLAQLLQATNRAVEAEPLMRRALAIAEKGYGPDHPNVATHLNALGELLRATDRPAEAESLYSRALKIYEASYGPDHPAVAALLNNLALVLQATDRLGEAEPLMRRAVEILRHFERVNGHRHPNCDMAEANHAALLAALG
jgi:tetratricopeptide (TPR) repeat protein